MAEMKVSVEMKDCGSSEKATPGSKEPTEDWAKVEYQAAQDSAHHHDSLVWQTTSIIWAGNLVMLGLIIKDNNVDTTSLHDLFIILGALGILLSLFVWSMQLQFRKIRNFKYKRCKEIEPVYHMKQHTDLPYCKGSQTCAYAVINMVFIAAWSWVLWYVC